MLIRFDLDELERKTDQTVMEIIREIAVELTNQLRKETPVGATGRLQESFQLFTTGDNVVYLGSRVPYAKGVWKGKPPHEPGFDAIEKWARRKLGDESAAGPVFSKIKREGTEPNDYVGRAVENTFEEIGNMRFDQL